MIPSYAPSFFNDSYSTEYDPGRPANFLSDTLFGSTSTTTGVTDTSAPSYPSFSEPDFDIGKNMTYDGSHATTDTLPDFSQPFPALSKPTLYSDGNPTTTTTITAPYPTSDPLSNISQAYSFPDASVGLTNTDIYPPFTMCPFQMLVPGGGSSPYARNSYSNAGSFEGVVGRNGNVSMFTGTSSPQGSPYGGGAAGDRPKVHPGWKARAELRKAQLLHNNKVIDAVNMEYRNRELHRVQAENSGLVEKVVMGQHAPQHANKGVGKASPSMAKRAAGAAMTKKSNANKKGLAGRTLGLNNMEGVNAGGEEEFGGESGKQDRPRRASARNVKKIVQLMESDGDEEDSGGSVYQGEDSGEEV